MSDQKVKTPEQKARDLLDRMEIANAQNFSSGELVELANLFTNETAISKLIMENSRLKKEKKELKLKRKELKKRFNYMKEHYFTLLYKIQEKKI